MFRVYVNVSFSNKILVLFFTRKCLLSIRTPNIESPFRPKKTYLVETRQSIKQTPKRPKKKEVVGKETPRTFRVSWCVRGDDSFLWLHSFIHVLRSARARVCVYIHIYIYIHAHTRIQRARGRGRDFCVSLASLSLLCVLFCASKCRFDRECIFKVAFSHYIDANETTTNTSSLMIYTYM